MVVGIRLFSANGVVRLVTMSAVEIAGVRNIQLSAQEFLSAGEFY